MIGQPYKDGRAAACSASKTDAALNAFHAGSKQAPNDQGFRLA